MKIKTYIQKIRSRYSEGVSSDDTRLSERLVFSEMLSTRSLLLSQMSDKKQSISAWSYQDLPCVEMIPVPALKCPCPPAGGCEFLRSKYKIPKFLNSLGGHIIESITTIDGDVSYGFTTFSKLRNFKGRKYTSKANVFYIHDGYLFLYQSRGPKVIAIRAVFEDPIEADNFISYCNDGCKGSKCKDCEPYLEKEFYLDPKLESPLITLVVESFLNRFVQSYADSSNNSQDNTNQKNING